MVNRSYLPKDGQNKRGATGSVFSGTLFLHIREALKISNCRSMAVWFQTLQWAVGSERQKTATKKAVVAAVTALVLRRQSLPLAAPAVARGKLPSSGIART